MRIEIHSGVARAWARDGYDGDSKPLSKNTSRDRPNSLDWWTASPRVEYVDQARKDAALHLYLRISAHAGGQPELVQFPALFEFPDARLRPDKGVIKACLRANPPLIRAVPDGAELLFEVTEDARQRLGIQ